MGPRGDQRLAAGNGFQTGGRWCGQHLDLSGHRFGVGRSQGAQALDHEQIALLAETPLQLGPLLDKKEGRDGADQPHARKGQPEPRGGRVAAWAGVEGGRDSLLGGIIGRRLGG